MQLVAYGAQDIYLTGNPQITFFKVVYRRHTNFSMEAIEQTINGTVAEGSRNTVTISRNGDLVGQIYWKLVLANEGVDAFNPGSILIDSVELEIGGQRIDKQTTQWNQIWADLTTTESKADGFKCMIGACGNSNTNVVGEVHVPLNFWFCRNPGLALPLIALQYHEVKLKCAWGAAVGTRKVVCDYIYLDTDERRRFAQVSHEYLIEQIQEQTTDDTGSFKLNFNHPVKELIWTSNATNTYGTAQLKLNGHDRFSTQGEEYFQLRQPLDYHTAVPGQNIVLSNRPLLPSSPLSVCQLTTGNATHKITQSAGVVTITLAAASQTNTAKVGDVIYVEVIRTVGDEVASEGAVGSNKGLNRITVSAYLSVTATTATTIVGTLSGLTGGSDDTGTVPGITTNAIAQNASGGVYTFAAVNESGDVAAGVTTVAINTQMVPVTSLLNFLIVGEQLYDEDGVDCGQFQAINGVTGNSITRASTQLDGSTASGAFTNTDGICVSSELINVTIIARAQDPVSRTGSLTSKINVYSFALKPEEHQPSGTCNFSRIDNAKLDIGTAGGMGTSDIIYAVNYNVLRIMSGMGGLAYSN